MHYLHILNKAFRTHLTQISLPKLKLTLFFISQCSFLSSLSMSRFFSINPQLKALIIHEMSLLSGTGCPIGAAVSYSFVFLTVKGLLDGVRKYLNWEPDILFAIIKSGYLLPISLLDDRRFCTQFIGIIHLVIPLIYKKNIVIIHFIRINEVSGVAM